MDLVSRFYRREEPLRRLIRELARDPAALTLDVGCKTGDVALPLAECVGQLVALDLRFHHEWRARRGRIRFVAGSALALPFRDGSFDQVVASECLQYVGAPEAAIDEFARVLKPGGVLILSFPEAGPFATFLDPYNVVLALKRLLRQEAPGRFTPHLRAAGILAHAAPRWRCEVHERRGTVMFIYTAWWIDKLQPLRLELWRRHPPLHWLSENAIRPMIRVLFRSMRLDFSLALGRLSYNNVIRLRKLALSGEAVPERPAARPGRTR